jgi:hypothetical protein
MKGRARSARETLKEKQPGSLPTSGSPDLVKKSRLPNSGVAFDKDDFTPTGNNAFPGFVNPLQFV